MTLPIKLGRTFAVVIGLGITAWVGWKILGDIWSDPGNIIAYACAFLIISLPYTIRWTEWGRRHLDTRPKSFWVVGGAMIVVAIVILAGFVALSVGDPSLPLNGTILGYGFVLLFGSGFMILATPTIWAISNLAKSSKEK